MLRSEIQIYKHLPDQAAREQFVDEFWQKRDPTAGTGENENKIEYERRLNYVEKWFREGGRPGWETDRGKVYLLLGEPDSRSTEQRDIVDRTGMVKRVLAEIWVYDYYRLYLEFIDEDELGIYRLRIWPVELLNAIDRAKFTINKPENPQQLPEFKTKFANNELNLQVQSKNISFEEKEGTMNARFLITVYVYRDYKEIDKFDVTRDLNGPKDNFLNQKEVALKIPYTLKDKGTYYFDIIVKDLNSGASYRDIINTKY